MEDLKVFWKLNRMAYDHYHEWHASIDSKNGSDMHEYIDHDSISTQKCIMMSGTKSVQNVGLCLVMIQCANHDLVAFNARQCVYHSEA